MKVCVNKDLCIGCGACTVVADQVFEFGDDEFATVKKDIENIDDFSEEINDAASGCPTGAIEVKEEK